MIDSPYNYKTENLTAQPTTVHVESPQHPYCRKQVDEKSHHIILPMKREKDYIEAVSGSGTHKLCDVCCVDMIKRNYSE